MVTATIMAAAVLRALRHRRRQDRRLRHQVEVGVVIKMGDALSGPSW
jgi:hypothetical protein